MTKEYTDNEYFKSKEAALNRVSELIFVHPNNEVCLGFYDSEYYVYERVG